VILPDLVRTTRLTLRRPRLSDARAVFEEYASDPEVTRYMDWPTHLSIGDAAACDVENRASTRVLEKLGLTYEGTMRRHLIRPNRSAEPRDSLVYARVR